MDPALSRLRVVGGRGDCPNDEGRFCADNELFERLVSEMAVTLAPPLSGPARTIGQTGWHLGVSTTVTTVQAAETYWVLGTEGADASPGMAFNSAPDRALIWNRLHVRKGLPLGFEVQSFVGQGMQTSMWVVGAGIKWALVEGFRTGAGQLPDVAVAASYSRSVGSSQVTFNLGSMELLLSKPFVLERSYILSPIVGLQGLAVDVESGVVDLTPGGAPLTADGAPAEDAFASCLPEPGQQASPPDNRLCTGDDADLANDVRFDPVTQGRLRVMVGGELRFDVLTFSFAIYADLLAPDLSADVRHLGSDTAARQLAFNVALGATL
jgi:hypothetical protein